MRKTKSKTKKKELGNLAKLIILAVFAILGLTGATVAVKINENGFIIRAKNATIEYSTEQVPAVIEGDRGELTTDDAIPTVEEIDGGRFELDTTELKTGDDYYEDLGAFEIYDVSTPEAFKDATLGKCIIYGNKFGAQCVSLARAFWFSYADRDVSTCGTGAAKGMMECSDENAGDDFEVFWADAKDSIQAGDWLVFDGGLYGHIGMALGPVTNGYVALLGENQGGRVCDGGGAATNIVNISIKKLIGYYRPIAYIIPEPEPEPEPEPIVPDTGIVK